MNANHEVIRQVLGVRGGEVSDPPTLVHFVMMEGTPGESTGKGQGGYGGDPLVHYVGTGQGGAGRSGLYPAEREGSSLEDVYEALGEAISRVTDLTILAGRHLPTSLSRKAERSLAGLLELRDIVLPATSEGGPF